MADKITKLFHSTIQHGPASDRIYLMKVRIRDVPDLLPAMDRMAAEQGYSKLFAKVPVTVLDDFTAWGYRREASVPRLFRGKETGVFLGKYFSRRRKQEREPERVKAVLDLTAKKAETGNPSARWSVHPCRPGDAAEMAQVYRTVFPTYPFPIHDPAYLTDTMKHHVRYYAVRRSGRIAALASAEMDPEHRNAEMTDFAALPDCRGHGLASRLLQRMEADMAGQGIGTVYTIARALSPGMNITFARAGYSFGGTLTNNTQIAGRIESMNVWYRFLRPAPVGNDPGRETAGRFFA